MMELFLLIGWATANVVIVMLIWDVITCRHFNRWDFITIIVMSQIFLASCYYWYEMLIFIWGKEVATC